MLSTSILVQASATTVTGSTIQKSLTMTAGADGRAFAVINDIYSYPATERVDYTNSCKIESIYYDDSYVTPRTLTGAGPSFYYPSPSFDPWSYSTGPLGPSFKVPTFLMSHNTTSNVVSPTITLSARDNITFRFDVTTEFQVDALNAVLGSLGVTATQQNRIVALTGFITGGSISLSIYNPNMGYIGSSNPLPQGYFAYPFLANLMGNYSMYFTSGSASFVRLTPVVVNATHLQMGQFATGEIKIPEDLTINEDYYKRDREPSQIAAVSYNVSAGDEYAFSASYLNLTYNIASSYSCWYFDVVTTQYGVSVSGNLLYGSSPVVSKAPVSGMVYVVLVANFVSRLDYSIGVEATTIATAPINQRFRVALPTPFGMKQQWYKFTVPSESMVRMNATQISGTMQYEIFNYTSTGVLYRSGTYNVGTNWIPYGRAESYPNYMWSMHMNAGEYLIEFMASASSEKMIQINVYPVESDSGNEFSMDLYTSKALAISATEFAYTAFNVTLRSTANVSMFYQLTLFDDYNRFINALVADGQTVSGHAPGIGNKWNGTTGLWEGTPRTGPAQQYYISASVPRWFSGNKTTQQSFFVPTYTGRYFLMLDFTQAFNTTKTGKNIPSVDPWTPYNNVTVTLKLDVYTPTPAAMKLGDLVIVPCNSTSGTGSASVTLSQIGVNRINLVLTGKLYTWTRISVTIVNGTRTGGDGGTGHVEEVFFDRIRYYGNRTNVYNYTTYNLLGLTYPKYNVVSGPQAWNKTTTYVIEFGTLMPKTLIAFRVSNATGAAHWVVSFNVVHNSTQAFSGLTPIAGAPPAPPPAPEFPVVPVLIGGGIVAAALVVVFIVLRKRKPA